MPDQVTRVIRWVPRRVDLEEIQVSPTRRGLNEAVVKQLKASIEALDLLQPIAVYFDADDVPFLVWGAHRLEALRRIDPKQILQVYDVSDLSPGERLLAECDENLKRAELSTEELRDVAKARLKAVATIKKEGEAAAAALAKAKTAQRVAKSRAKVVTVSRSDDQTTVTTNRGGRPKGKTAETRAKEEIAASAGVSERTVRRAVADKPPVPVAQPALLGLIRLQQAWRNATAEEREMFLASIKGEKAA